MNGKNALGWTPSIPKTAVHLTYLTRKTQVFLGLFLSLFLLAQHTNAQCTITCKDGSSNAPGEAAVNELCELDFTLSAALMTSTNCAGPFELEVRDLNTDTLIVSGIPNPFVTAQNVEDGQLLEVIVTDLNSGNSCSSFKIVMDNLPPQFTDCNDTLVTCISMFDPMDITAFPPDVFENCDPNFNLDVELMGTIDCNSSGGTPPPDTIVKIFVRRWTASDNNNGDENQCFQQIRFLAPDLDSIMFAEDVTVDCLGGIDPTITGYPTFMGQDITENVDMCMLQSFYTDDTLSMSGCSDNDFKVLRDWTVFYHCDGTMLTSQQVIFQADMTAPVITCPTLTPVGTATNPGECGADFALPIPTATDDCSDISYKVNTPFGIFFYGNNNSIQFNNVSPGTYDLDFIATDQCNNADTCTTQLVVVDNESPTAICAGLTNVSLPTNGIAIVPACVFDAAQANFNPNTGQFCENVASYDDCSPVRFMVSRDGVNFSENAIFNCDDLGANVMVTVKVYELNNPNSFTNCMVEVEVEDKLPPAFTFCPNSQTIDCEADITNLSAYGEPTVNDNCDFTLAYTFSDNSSNCGNGSIIRTWTATDGSGNASTCTQVLTIGNATPFDGTGIVFPSDYTVMNNCILPNQLDPEDLPAPFNETTLPATPCAMLAVSYSDLLFDLNYPSCYKIIRTWRVIDWCQYDAANPSAGGIWEGVQLIKVLDDQAPTLLAPSQINDSVNDACTVGNAVVMATATDGCNPNLTITNSFNNTTNGDASGDYPLGETTVTFAASDACGNTTIATTLVIISDNKLPSIICNDNLATDIQAMNGNIMAMANVAMFVYGGSDNCTDASQLKYTMRRHIGTPTSVPTTTDLVFNCSDVEAMVELEIWVEDLAGNADYCIVEFDVQDNNNLCESDDNEDLTIAGAIQTEMGEDVEEVMVNVMSSSNAFPDTTGLGGSFAFPDLPMGYNYTVVPEKDMDDDNGVTTWDIILIKRHILSVEALDSPYKLIAADVNNSGTITLGDVVQIKQMILSMITEFPNNNSWRFVAKDYIFPDPTNPWLEEFPEILQLEDTSENVLEANFTGVKIGDVNASASPNANATTTENRNANNLLFHAKEAYFSAGESVYLDLYSTDFQDIAGFQFGLDFAAANLEFIGANAGQISLTDLSAAIKKEGTLGVTWHTMNGVDLSPDEPLFSLAFRAKRSGKLSELITLNKEILAAEAYRLEGNISEMEQLNIAFQFTQKAAESLSFQLYQNTPNPFHESTQIAFDLPEESWATLRIFDMSGKVVFETKNEFNAGYQVITIDRKKLGGNGVYYYQVSTPMHTETKRMVLVN